MKCKKYANALLSEQRERAARLYGNKHSVVNSRLISVCSRTIIKNAKNESMRVTCTRTYTRTVFTRVPLPCIVVVAPRSLD